MEPGSIRGVVERLTYWCSPRERGLARVEWDSVYARQEVVDRLRPALVDLGVSLVEIDLPPGEDGHKTALGLIEKLRSSCGWVGLFSGVGWGFVVGGVVLGCLVL